MTVGGGQSGNNQQAAPAAPARPTTSKPLFESNGRYRSDGRCKVFFCFCIYKYQFSFLERKGSVLILLPLLLGGVENPLEDGTPAECDPNSEYWCCSGKKEMLF